MSRNNMPLISVIVPVFNDCELLGKCLDSILEQSFTNFEIILIDDGSSDSSGSICDYYASIDSRITVIHKQNEGVSIARNTGISIAKGPYICFADADDYVEPNWLIDLYDAAEQHPDALIASNIDIQENDRRYVRYSNFKGLMPIEVFWKKGEWGNPINKIYKRDVIYKLGLSFDRTQKVHEDELFVGQYASAFDYAFVCERVGYHYLNFEPLGKKYSSYLTLENAYYEYFHLKEYNPICSKYLVDRLLMSVYDSILNCGEDADSSVSKFKMAVGADITYVNGRKKAGFRLLKFFKSECVWRFIFKIYLRFKLI